MCLVCFSILIVSTTLNFIGTCFFSILDVSTTLNFIGTCLFFHHRFPTTLNFIRACLFFHPYCFDNQSCTREVLYLSSFCCKPCLLCQPHLCKHVLHEFPFSNQFLYTIFLQPSSPTKFSPTKLLSLI